MEVTSYFDNFGKRPALLNKLKSVILFGSYDDQIKFIKTYTIFKVEINIVDYWINVYGTLDRSKPDDGIKFKNSIQFITIAYSQKLVEYNAKQINIINNMLSHSNETENVINAFKLAVFSNNGLQPSNILRSRSGSHIINRLTKHIIPPFLKKESSLEITLLKNIDADDIALELTRICCKSFLKIRSPELLSIINGGKYIEQHAPNMIKLINIFKKISKWVPHEIIKQETVELQEFMIKKFIDVAKECEYLCNYHSLLAIVAGLNNPYIRRLKDAWSTASQKSLNSLETLMSDRKNYQIYRNTLRKKIKKHACIPYVGLFSSDIMHALECENFITPRSRRTFDIKINDDMANQVYEIIKLFEKCQRPYEITKNNRVAFYIKNIVVINRKRMSQIYNTIKLNSMRSSDNSSSDSSHNSSRNNSHNNSRNNSSDNQHDNRYDNNIQYDEDIINTEDIAKIQNVTIENNIIDDPNKKPSLARYFSMPLLDLKNLNLNKL